MIAPQIPMQFATLFIAALLALPAAGLFTWAWVAMARVDADLRSFTGFEGLHFDICWRAARIAQTAIGPSPG